MATGIVFLVGAGPGDPGLIAARGLQAVRRAGLLIYDPEVSPALVAEAPEGVRLVEYRGEERERVAAIMAEAALAGQSVCRLYFGGPLLGGAAEEAPGLAARGVPVEIIPVVLPELAAAVYAGVGLGRPTNLAIVDAAGPVNWPALTQGVATILARLDLAQLPDVVGELVAHGRSPSMPAAVIWKATLVGQQSVAGPLGEIAAAVAAKGLTGEAVLVTGDAARQRSDLNWYEAKPLFGQCVLVTRSKSQAGPLSEKIYDLGGRAWAFPAITTAPPESCAALDQAIGAIQGYQWLVITSPNGAEYFRERLMAAGKDVRALAHLRIAAVGSATAKALAAAGIRADVTPAEFRSAALPAAMAPQLAPGDRVLMARADLADPTLAAELIQLGATVDDVVAYRTLQSGGDVAGLKAALARREIHYATFTSPSTVASVLAQLGGPAALAGVRIACMGPETKKAAEAAGLAVHVLAATTSVDGLVEAIVADAGQQKG